MKQTAIDHTEALARDWLSLFLTGLGITFAPHEYFGGLFLSLAGASLSMHYGKRKQGRKSLLVVMCTAFFVSHLGAMAAHWYFPGLSIQFVMAFLGAISRHLAVIAFGAAGILEDRAPEAVAKRVEDEISGIADRLTGGRKKDEEGDE